VFERVVVAVVVTELENDEVCDDVIVEDAVLLSDDVAVLLAVVSEHPIKVSEKYPSRASLR
jgi:hypothetical protein